MLSLRRLRATAALWWKLLRMQRVTREGWFYVGATLVVGAAAINTGNNLLYLVLGLQLALLILSALLSEWTLQGIQVERQLPPQGSAGRAFELRLVVRNRKKRLSSHSLLIQELGLPEARAWLARIPPQGSAELRCELTAPRRGELQLQGLRITTRFPFGFFEKSREQPLPASLLIHPAGEAQLALPRMPVRAGGELPQPQAGNGSEFHALRDFRSGDDLRQVHWPSTARSGKVLVIETERERRRRITLLADTRGLDEGAVDGLAEAAMALGRRLLAEGCELGLAWPGASLAPGAGRGWLLRLGDAAARLRAAPADAPAPRPHAGADPVELPRLELEAKGELIARPLPAPKEGASGKLSLATVQRGILQAASAASFAALAISGELPLWAGATFLLALGAGWLLREEAPPWLRRSAGPLLLLVLAASAFAVWQGAEVMILAPAFATVLAASRLLVRRGPLDDPLLLLAALLMIAGGAGLTGDLAFGLLFSLFALLITLALATTQLRRELEAVGGRAASAARGSVSGSLLSSLGALSLLSLFGAVFLFLVFPRVSAQVFLPGPQARAGDPGDRIELGGIGVLKDDPTPLARVRFAEGPPRGEIYWRTRTFAEWDGAGWRRSEGERRPVAGGGGFHPLRHLEPPFTEAEIELLRPTEALLVPGYPLDLRFPPRRGQLFPLLWQEADGVLSLEGASQPLRYRVRATQAQQGERVERDPASGVAQYLALPRLDPRFSSLSRRFRNDGPPAALAEEISAYLQREYRYTRDLGGRVEDPLAHFLFERKEGHCEFFATALTLLLRSHGIPARVVAGYYGATWVPAGEHWVVREGDAHAWVEAWIPGQGWLRWDPTPAEQRPGTAEGLWASVVGWVDLLRMHWANWVLDYDGRRQARLAQGVAKSFASEGRGGASGSSGLKLAGALVSLVAFGLVLYRFVPLWLPKGRRREAERHEASALFRLVKRRLRRKGLHLPASAPSSAWAAAARSALGEEAAPYERALAAYEEARFGGRALGPAERRRLRRQLPR